MEYSIFGCRLNKYYLNQWLEYFRSHPFADHPYLITTCEVTDRAKQKRIKLAKKKLTDGCHVYITGCGSLKKGKTISSDQFYDLYSELRFFSSLISLLPESPKEMQGYLLPSYSSSHLHTKKFVVIQTGCDNYCTFCLTVHKRGSHHTRSCEDILQEIQQFASGGGKEIVLTGVNIAAWGCSHTTCPQESQFPFLLKEILSKTTIPRIRLSSLGPEYLSDEFFEVIKNPRILPHFHLSIQSFSDGVLQRMKRNYTAKTLDTVLTKFRALPTKVPLSLGADIIVGFPGETQEEFAQTLEAIQRYHLNKVHSFPFSDHHTGESIPASLLPNQVDAATKKQREHQIKKTADTIVEQFYLLNKGIEHCVLVEGKRSGRTENYLKVDVDSKYKRGDIVQIIL